MKIQLRYKTCVWSQTIQISNNSISPQLFWFLMLQKQLFALTRTQGNPKKRPGLGFSEAFEDITCVWFFFPVSEDQYSIILILIVLEGSVLTKTLLPFCVFSSTVDTTTRVKRGDLFSYNLKTSSKGGATSFKPWELYGDLTELYGAEEGWVMDFCSGSGELFGIFFPVNIFFF